jgi:hypothetical protein
VGGRRIDFDADRFQSVMLLVPPGDVSAHWWSGCGNRAVEMCSADGPRWSVGAGEVFIELIAECTATAEFTQLEVVFDRPKKIVKVALFSFFLELGP